MITAKIILDSINESGNRLTTFELRYPKFIHGEFMTHRVFSRNASSSRAIPLKKYLEEVRSDELRAAPVFWGINQKGMQAAEELKGRDKDTAQQAWRDAALKAADAAEYMSGIGGNPGPHKQIVNRILEPFVHINVICTSTEFKNFFGLRLHKDAQPEMRTLAEKMWEAYKLSRPIFLPNETWHLPYVGHSPFDLNLIKVSVARCCRVSYKSHETGKESTLEEDIKLYERIAVNVPLHSSPAEHQATPDNFSQLLQLWLKPQLHGNLTGWIQFRKTLEGEALAPLPEGYSW